MQTETDSALISTFAHDLRVPLRSIMMSTQRIQRKPEGMSVETLAKLDEIIAAVRRQEELISSVVEFDQALSPGLAEDKPLLLRLVIQTACMKVDAYRQSRNGTVALVSDPTPQVLVPGGVSRVIEKVLHNSLKFHPAGHVPRVVVEASLNAAGEVLIRVIDNGMGVDVGYLESVFEPFKRLNSPSDYPGAGLGLSISRRLMHSIGGSISFEEAARDGSSIRLSLPAVN